MVQGELFRTEQAFDRPTVQGGASFLRKYQFTLTLEKLIIAALALVIVFGITFSFGVTQGKKQIEDRLAVFRITSPPQVLTILLALSSKPESCWPV